eukprot:CAMPEP_0114123472 /NCGR_PEP_ID=MMETSP0043_2-20121206/8233_1 /TAXON_ID=464988 /ORGANISM="Hemiselmis andersenii, Strain CCMP644" /LENGTH=153 /DNA_ID=CAMNT_0001216229 /DNA_START=61 /DNA_END=519 /DNA_ORIENTATION=-
MVKDTYVGGWLAPNDAILSVTPLWPRPDRSPGWVVTWVLIVVVWLILMIADAEDNSHMLHQLKTSVEAALAATGFNAISSPGAFWFWLERVWVPSADVVSVSFPSSGAQSFRTQRPGFTSAQGPFLMASKTMVLRQKARGAPQACAEGRRVGG